MLKVANLYRYMGICLSCRKSKQASLKGKSVCLTTSRVPLNVVAEESGGSAGTLKVQVWPGGDPGCHVIMANTISNMKMTNPIKGLVSKSRRRYKADGFNLDLTYIQNNLIAMGYPAEKWESMYRNHIDDVVKFLESKHKDHYKIYNLCSERSYNTEKFQQRVATYAFDDHNPPKMELIQPFCADVQEWLNANSDNVAVVHCKAGKGRTGTMVCCYMLHSGLFPTADEALNHYGQKRTHDRKGVTIPSQRRYVNYYAMLVQQNLQYKPVSLYIREIHIEPLPIFNGGQGSLQFVISKSSAKVFTSCVHEIKKGSPSITISLDGCIPLVGDIKLEFFNKPKMMRKEKLFHFWFNTFFVARNEQMDNGNVRNVEHIDHRQRDSVVCYDSELRTFSLTLNKLELDDAHKDKQNKYYSADFKISLLMQKVPNNMVPPYDWQKAQAPALNCAEATNAELQPPPSTASESSEADSINMSSSAEEEDSNEDGWESGESTYL